MSFSSLTTRFFSWNSEEAPAEGFAVCPEGRGVPVSGMSERNAVSPDSTTGVGLAADEGEGEGGGEEAVEDVALFCSFGGGAAWRPSSKRPSEISASRRFFAPATVKPSS